MVPSFVQQKLILRVIDYITEHPITKDPNLVYKNTLHLTNVCKQQVLQNFNDMPGIAIQEHLWRRLQIVQHLHHEATDWLMGDSEHWFKILNL